MDYSSHDHTYQRRRRDGAQGWFPESSKFHEPIKTLFRSTVGSGSGGLIEIGCGAGEIALFLAESGYAVTGVDISPTAIHWAQDRLAQAGLSATFIACDIVKEIPCPADYFHVALDSWCLHCIIGPDRSRYLGNVRSVLMPGGRFFVFTGCANNRTEHASNFDPRTGLTSAPGSPGPRCYPPPETILGELRQVGFTVIHYEVRDTNDAVDMLIVQAVKATEPIRPGRGSD